MFGNVMFAPDGMLDFSSRLFEDLYRMDRDMSVVMDATFGRPGIHAGARGDFPAVNVSDTPEAVQVYLFVPGFDPADWMLSIQGNVLSLEGERKAMPGEGAGGYHLRERFTGRFHRIVTLSEEVDPDQVHATYKNGILSVIMGKRQEARPRSIPVKDCVSLTD